MAYSKWIPTEQRVIAVLEASHNRPVSDRHVNVLAIAMERGNWKPEISPLLFYPDGRLADGQHRLWAWLRSGMQRGIWFWSAVIDEEDITKVDAGRNRSTADHSRILRLGFSGRQIAVAKIALALESQEYDVARLRANHDMVLEAAKRYEVADFARHGIPAPVTGTLAFVGKHRGVLPFFEQVVHGENLTRQDPAYHVRSMIGASGRSTGYGVRDQMMIKTIRAWNAYARGEKLGVLRAPDRPWHWIEIERKEAKDGQHAPE